MVIYGGNTATYDDGPGVCRGLFRIRDTPPPVSYYHATMIVSNKDRAPPINHSKEQK